MNTLLNPSDLASRGMNAKQVKNHNVWFNGPSFLWGPYSVEKSEFEVSLTDPEVKKVSALTCNSKGTDMITFKLYTVTSIICTDVNSLFSFVILKIGGM